MATVTTRSISGKDRWDKIAVKVDPTAYEEKWGVLQVTVTQIDWGTGSDSGDYGTVDVRVPQYNPDNDTILLDHFDLTTSGGTESIGQKYFIAVNNGVPGPAAFVEPDGTWDLMHLSFELPEDNELDPLTVTLTYSVSFTDLTPVSNPSDDGTLDLAIDNVKTADSVYITEPASTFSGKCGYVIAQINDLHTVVNDRPDDDTLIDAPSRTDSVPLFTIVNERTPVGFGKSLELVKHPMTKVSGSKTYDETLLVFAVNNGKVDGNATNVKASDNYARFLRATLQKIQNWTCDDWVDSTLDYALDFTEVA